MDESSQPQIDTPPQETVQNTPTEAPAEQPTQEVTQPSEPSQATAPEMQGTQATDTTGQTQSTPTQDVSVDDEDVQTYQPVAPVPPIDFSQLPADENGLLDPNALAGVINQRIAQAEQNASQRAQQIYAEQEQEKRLWEKAYDKYPDLKKDKELQGFVHQARLGEATELLSKSNDPNSVKLPTPSQIADKLFKRIGSAKSEGIQQATTNTVVQKSAQLETASRTSNDSSDALAQARANLKNPNTEVRKQAANKLLQNYLGWDK